eukprot:6213246-Pleurochrysis_carterae.AAC.1
MSGTAGIHAVTTAATVVVVCWLLGAPVVYTGSCTVCCVMRHVSRRDGRRAATRDFGTLHPSLDILHPSKISTLDNLHPSKM